MEKVSIIIRRFPVRTRRRPNVYTTSSQRYGRCIDVETTVCTYWRVVFIFILDLFIVYSIYPLGCGVHYTDNCLRTDMIE